MADLCFDWDEKKSRENKRKHGVSFEEAQTVFFDDAAVEFYDDEHPEWEDRFLLLGVSAGARLLLVCHCVREDGNLVRIISARKASKTERKLYPIQ